MDVSICRQALDGEGRLGTEAGAAPSGAGEDSRVCAMKKTIRVLCVDDHAFLVDGLRSRIALEDDMQVVARLPTADGLTDLVKAEHIDVVLLDIEMPGPDPFQAMAGLQQECPDVRTLMLSAYVQERYIDAAIDAGAHGYLYKGDGLDAIVSAIRKAAEGQFAFGPKVLEFFRLVRRDTNAAG
jgi:DNA-binding NarL/FixJ family response regulator